MESSQITKFDSFPAEIIKRIASFSQCESVIALMRVNRRMYQMCNDITVFKAIVKNRNGNEFASSWECGYISGNTSTSDWARLALADSKAQHWTATQNRRIADLNQELLVDVASPGLPLPPLPSSSSRWKLPWVPKSRRIGPRSRDNTAGVDIARWAPQLVALHHPFIADVDMVGMVSGLREILPNSSQDADGHAAVAFCITATILHHGSAGLKDGTLFDTAYQLADEQYRQIMLDIRGSSERETPGSELTFIACALFSNIHTVLRGVPLPSPYHIPFQSLFDTPLPFSETKFTSRSHLHTMTSPAFLIDGEWVGYYSYSLNLEVARFDPPMREIRFSAEPEDNWLRLSASGIDHVGPFSLTGTINPSGSIQMAKVYTTRGHRWYWSASMTPFGIVGTWGHGVRGQDQQGHVWLWKREWS